MEQSTAPTHDISLEKLLRVYVGFVEFFLALRFITIFLALEGKFAEWILIITQPLFSPFTQWVSPTLPSTLFTIDFSSLTTMLLYVLTAEFLTLLFRIIRFFSEKYSQK